MTISCRYTQAPQEIVAMISRGALPPRRVIVDRVEWDPSIAPWSCGPIRTFRVGEDVPVTVEARVLRIGVPVAATA